MPETAPCAVCSAELTVDMNLRDLGRTAAERLLAAIEGQFTAGVERLPCSLVLRESSRPRTKAPISALGEPAS